MDHQSRAARARVCANQGNHVVLFLVGCVCWYGMVGSSACCWLFLCAHWIGKGGGQLDRRRSARFLLHVPTMQLYAASAPAGNRTRCALISLMPHHGGVLAALRMGHRGLFGLVVWLVGRCVAEPIPLPFPGTVFHIQTLPICTYPTATIPPVDQLVPFLLTTPLAGCPCAGRAL